MNRYLVRRTDYGEEWEDAKRISAVDSRDAAEDYAAHQCSQDPECYRGYESGVLLEVKSLDTDEIANVVVSVRHDPVFNGRVQR